MTNTTPYYYITEVLFTAIFFNLLCLGIRKNYKGDFPDGPVVKNLPCNTGDMGLILCQGTEIPGEGNGNPLQYSCLENSTDREA